MLKDASILGAARILPIGLAVVQSIVVARLLGPEAYGAVALITAYPTLIFGLLNVRTAETTTRFLAVFDADRSPRKALAVCLLSYVVDLAVAGLSFVIVIASATWVGPRLLDDPGLTPLLIIYALSFLPNSLRPTSTSILVVTGRFGVAGGIEIGTAALRTTTVVGLVVAGFGVPGIVYGTVLSTLMAGAATIALAHRVGRVRWGSSLLTGRWTHLSGHRREIVRFFVLSDLNEVIGVVTKNVDVLLLGYYRPTTEIGYYNLAKSLTAQLSNLVSAIRVVGFPHVMRLWSAGEWHAMWRYVRVQTRTISIPGIAGVGVLMVVVAPLIAAVYGPEFSHAAPVTRLLLLQIALLLASLWVGIVFVAWGDVHIRLAARMAGTVAGLAIMVIWIPQWGMMAAAAGLVVQQCVTGVITMGWVYTRAETRAQEASLRRTTLDSVHD